jgi:hypothetical protein
VKGICKNSVTIIKTTSTENRERILKAVRGKKQITYKGNPIKIEADFSTETLKTFQALNALPCKIIIQN